MFSRTNSPYLLPLMRLIETNCEDSPIYSGDDGWSYSPKEEKDG
jgi:hypothetical protein